ncbi:MAG: DUF389 domain-containing protein [Solirubrobacterales bacterium]
MVHLRIIAPSHECDHLLELLKRSQTVTNLVYLPRAAHKPEGDVVLCDVAREEASVIISDLREFDVPVRGSISIEEIDSQISVAADEAEHAAKGLAGDAVVWEEVEARTSEETELSANFLAFMVLACLIASVGIILDSPVLIIGAMVIGPEFGPLAGLCVATVQRRREMALRSLRALAIGFPAGITAAFLFGLIARNTGLADDTLTTLTRPLTQFISHPDGMSFIVAFIAGIAGMLSLTAAKSGALVGVLISVTTIPAAANIGLAAAYANWGEWRGAMAQLAVNLSAIFLAAVGTLFVQRLLYRRRRVRHLQDGARGEAGLPVGHSLHEHLAADRPEPRT